MQKKFIFFGDVAYKIDLDAYNKCVVPPKNEDMYILEQEIKVTESDNGKKETTTINKYCPKESVINSIKSELLQLFVNIVLDSSETIEIDDASLGVERALEDTSLSFKIAFNTLLNENILVEIDE